MCINQRGARISPQLPFVAALAWYLPCLHVLCLSFAMRCHYRAACVQPVPLIAGHGRGEWHGVLPNGARPHRLAFGTRLQRGHEPYCRGWRHQERLPSLHRGPCAPHRWRCLQAQPEDRCAECPSNARPVAVVPFCSSCTMLAAVSPIHMRDASHGCPQNSLDTHDCQSDCRRGCVAVAQGASDWRQRGAHSRLHC